ncbi:MAG: hypothetical protein ACE5GB_13510 [Acidimicrobiales bacterium]
MPDYVASAGGVIAGVAAHGVYPTSQMQAKLDGIHDRTATILHRARAEDRPETEIAHEMARVLLEAD